MTAVSVNVHVGDETRFTAARLSTDTVTLDIGVDDATRSVTLFLHNRAQCVELLRAAQAALDIANRMGGDEVVECTGRAYVVDGGDDDDPLSVTHLAPCPMHPDAPIALHAVTDTDDTARDCTDGIRHRFDIERDHTGRYRAVCVCGWQSGVQPSSFLAYDSGDDHVRTLNPVAS